MAFVDALIHNLPEEEWLLPQNLGWEVKDIVRPLANDQDAPGHMILQIRSVDAPGGAPAIPAQYGSVVRSLQSGIQKYKSTENLVFFRGVHAE